MFWKKNAPTPPGSPAAPGGASAGAPQDESGSEPGEARDLDRRVADTLVRNFLRREDFVARYGGEEFVVVVPDSSAHLVRQRADRVRQAISEIGFSKGNEHFSVTPSVGVAVLGPGDTGGAAPSLHPSRAPSQAPARTISSGSLRLNGKIG